PPQTHHRLFSNYSLLPFKGHRVRMVTGKQHGGVAWDRVIHEIVAPATSASLQRGSCTTWGDHGGNTTAGPCTTPRACSGLRMSHCSPQDLRQRGRAETACADVCYCLGYSSQSFCGTRV